MVSLLAGHVLATLAGRGLLHALGADCRLGGLAGVARAWSAGLFALAVTLLVAGGLGAPVGWPSLVAGALALAALARLGHRTDEPSRPPPESWGPLGIAARILLLAALGLFVAKTLTAPLWSWDHFAIWGIKARWMVEGAALDLDFLRDPEFVGTRPDHPLALPMAWRFLALAATPGSVVFRTTHILFGVALIAILRDAVHRRTGRRTWSDLVAAYAALSPLFWDTEALGLAEMPLALVAVLAADLLLDLSVLPARAAAAAGALLGLLPWIKQEGLPLALVLAVCGCLHLRRRERRGERSGRSLLLLAGTATLAAGAMLFRLVALAPGVGFLSGDWRSRALERLPRLLDVGATFTRELLVPDWLGFWLVFLVGLGLAATRRAPRGTGASLLLLAVAAQVLLYLFVCYVAPAEPAVQIRAAGFRIAAALVPLGLLGLATFGTRAAPSLVGDIARRVPARADHEAVPPVSGRQSASRVTAAISPMPMANGEISRVASG
jgi:hypothetical protein